MGRTKYDSSDDEYSVIGDKGDIGFIDIANCNSSTNNYESDLFKVSSPFPLIDMKPRWGFVGEPIFDCITIQNTSDEPLNLESVNIYDSKPENSFTLSLMEPPDVNSDKEYIEDFIETYEMEDRVIKVGQTLKVWLSCKAKEIGLHSTAVHFTIGDHTIERMSHVLVEDTVSRSLLSSRPFYRPKKNKPVVVDHQNEDTELVVGQRPSSRQSHGPKRRLPNYPIPQDIRKMVLNRQVPDVLYEGLTRKNHFAFFKALIAMEEIKMEEDMRAYDLERVTMKTKRYTFLTLEVPGLAEKRPSLVKGDFITAKFSSDGRTANNTAYQGYIHRVEAEEIFLKFSPELHKVHQDNNLYDVQFTYNRIGMKRLYQAIEAASTIENNFLFPSTTKPLLPAPLIPISCNLNEEQRKAVEMIHACKGGSPYIIHGPPGTGKTMTLIESILQSYNLGRNSKILVCAPSNSAADHILERIIREKSGMVERRDIFRLNAMSRPYEDVDPEFLEFCFIEDSAFQCPSLRDIQRYRIIISTYTSAAILYSVGMKRGHFSYIFLDEAAQASEPETMVPLSQFYSRNTVVVLAGDPMQLGPVVFSKLAESYGLGTSYLERLLNSEFYNNGNFMTKLVRNYRTHPAILHLPSQLFYNGELLPCKAGDSGFEKLWENLVPDKEFPMVFMGVQGCDEREGTDPSWFNRTEASKVVEIVTALTDVKGMQEEDIGVITPYRQQVLKIRGALESRGIVKVKVGSVEQFQGQEKQVILISTVRSTIKHNEFDKIHYLGFLCNPRRFNVSITRARSLLMVIGNPHILCKDPHWNDLLWYCVEKASYKGCFLPVREELSPEEPQTEEAQCIWEGDTTWQQSKTQWGTEGNNCEDPPENVNNWEDQPENVNNWEDQPENVKNWEDADAKVNNWEDQPANVNNWEDQPANVNNWGESSENVKTGVEEISTQLSDMSWGNAQNVFVPSNVPWE